MFYQRIFLTMIATAALVAASAQQLTVTLTGSMHNGSSIPCFGKKVGTITSTVTGGTAPYTYDWSNGESTPSFTGVSAGYYSVNVKDANGTVEKAEITLTEPEELKVSATVSSFANGHNISCFECNNGYIQVSATQGTPPYSYAWSDGPSTAQSRYALGPHAYKVTVTDANGCESSTSVNITQPERSDWTMNGNAGTNPATQYIGTSDDKDVVFKANGQEALRLKANGDISLMGSLDGDGPLYRRDDGLLGSGFPVYPERPAERCHLLGSYPYWETRGNAFHQLCPEEDPLLGTLGERPLKIVTNGIKRITVTQTGMVGIGTDPPIGEVGDYRLFVENGIVCRDVLVKLGDWPDYVFEPDYKPMPLNELREYLGVNKHLPGIPSAPEVEANNGVELGDLQKRMLKVMEEQALYILQLEKGQRELELRLQRLEAKERNIQTPKQ